MATKIIWAGTKNPIPSRIEVGDYFESPNTIMRREVVSILSDSVFYTEWVKDWPADLTSSYSIYSTGGSCKRSTIRAWSLPKKSIFA